MSPAVVFVFGVLAYLVIGVLFALPFVLRGVQRIDPVAVGAPWRVRLLFAPGAAALWPILLTRWIRVRGSGKSATEATDIGNIADQTEGAG